MKITTNYIISDANITAAAQHLRVSIDDMKDAIHIMFGTGRNRITPVVSCPTGEISVRCAIASGEVGFRNGWVSSTALAPHLFGHVPPNKRREFMRMLGYDWHPALTDGRTDRHVAPDNAKPKLYVTAGHPSLTLTSVGDVERAYSRDQGSYPDNRAC